ncbi:circularly permuted type 2 ATP-grasp protein [Breoghania sp. L-A4]|uniref:circularly permuted type 2 ATP-grasp protein n=1 Tax=Breoghania sp. L-A4 TaxID=2304600 RepID=UPI0020BFD27C|nr:circularly permuted type 2 ATP-grasp protein [Breoghania sp. L-A4]
MLDSWLQTQPKSDLARLSREAETIFRRHGITFAVYGTDEETERLIPFDIIPRIIAAREWRKLAAGIDQRVRALNALIHDLYHRQEIIRAGRIPAELVIQNEAFLPEMIGHTPARQVYAHIIGTDLVRVSEDEFYVLEDNTRTPSGVSYMLENRETMMHMFPELFQNHRIAPIEHYPELLRETLESVAPPACDGPPTIAVLTPGIYNSAYYEHAFLADTMGVELVEGRDLFVKDGFLYMRTTREPERVDVLYRRIDDDFLDPLTFRPDSAIGVPGLFDVYRAGRVTITNAPGTGIADDKAMYTYMPEIIEFYTGQKPILNNVPTWKCEESDSLKYVLENLHELVVKEVHGSGGYGMLVGPASTKKERAAFTRKLKARPGNYIAQPTLALSACPTFVGAGVAPRHVDLRPYVLIGDKVRITPGGLTRVAMKKGSLVVNSSQGGGTKDTWVLED